MKWKRTAKRLPPEGATVLCCWGIEPPGMMGVATFAGNGQWHEPEDDEDDYRAPEHWMELPPSPLGKPDGDVEKP